MLFRPLRWTIITIIIIIYMQCVYVYIFGSLEKANDNFDIRHLNDFFCVYSPYNTIITHHIMHDTRDMREIAKARTNLLFGLFSVGACGQRKSHMKITKIEGIDTEWIERKKKSLTTR